MKKLLTELYYRTRWEGFYWRLPLNISTSYQPPRKGHAAWRLYFCDDHIAKSLHIHLARAHFSMIRHYPHLDADVTVGERGVW